MVISTNVLFHFTKSLENLISIMRNDFEPRYCLEDYSNLFRQSGMEFKIAFPMTCFCDLPFSQLKKHLNYYGNYGIGLKKAWGIRKEINPVLYMHSNADLAAYCGTLLEYLNKQGEKTALDSMVGIMRHIKLYEGIVTQHGERKLKKFYDEREWRWVPFMKKDGNPDMYSLKEEEYQDPETRATADMEAAGSIKLQFEPEDIEYIIVSSKNEILPMINAIEDIDHKYQSNTVKVLTTKIISAEQIETDF